MRSSIRRRWWVGCEGFSEEFCRWFCIRAWCGRIQESRSVHLLCRLSVIPFRRFRAVRRFSRPSRRRRSRRWSRKCGAGTRATRFGLTGRKRAPVSAGRSIASGWRRSCGEQADLFQAGEAARANVEAFEEWRGGGGDGAAGGAVRRAAADVFEGGDGRAQGSGCDADLRPGACAGVLAGERGSRCRRGGPGAFAGQKRSRNAAGRCGIGRRGGCRQVALPVGAGWKRCWQQAEELSGVCADLRGAAGGLHGCPGVPGDDGERDRAAVEPCICGAGAWW